MIATSKKENEPQDSERFLMDPRGVQWVTDWRIASKHEGFEHQQSGGSSKDNPYKEAANDDPESEEAQKAFLWAIGFIQGETHLPIWDEPGSETELPDAILRMAADPDSWEPYNGPRGGTGWRNIQSGEVAYVDEKPGGGSGDVDDSPSMVAEPAAESATQEFVAVKWKQMPGWVTIKEVKQRKKKLVMADGSDLPPHLAKVRVPYPWTKVKVNLDPKADKLLTGRDGKNRKQQLNSAEYKLRRAALKFTRVRALASEIGDIREQNTDNMHDPDTDLGEIAIMSEVLFNTGIRIGSKKDTKAEVQAYGLSTIEARHIRITATGKVKLMFTGKKGQDRIVEIKHPDSTKFLREKKKSLKPKETVFHHTDKQVNKYLETLGSGEYTSRDFRTLKATSEAAKMVAAEECCKTMKEYKQHLKMVSTKISVLLGNTPRICLQDYIDPSVWTKWKVD